MDQISKEGHPRYILSLHSPLKRVAHNMNCISHSLSTKPLIFACLSNKTPPLPPHTNPNHSLENINNENEFKNRPKLQKTKRKQKQAPSVAEIERVIGAGVFRDRDNRNAERSKTLFDSILSNSIGKTEGKVERKLRETGEWIINGTEKASNSTGKNILLFVFSVVLPLWILSFLIASGIIIMPFNTPYLEDLIM